ncbi:hypothetical protein N7475_004479 [Penicillium sp. IBT 31633x]|nr:hypothetical protein N7475_004479 [Penicillium sp. IBT 31633x]
MADHNNTRRDLLPELRGEVSRANSQTPSVSDDLSSSIDTGALYRESPNPRHHHSVEQMSQESHVNSINTPTAGSSVDLLIPSPQHFVAVNSEASSNSNFSAHSNDPQSDVPIVREHSEYLPSAPSSGSSLQSQPPLSVPAVVRPQSNLQIQRVSERQDIAESPSSSVTDNIETYDGPPLLRCPAREEEPPSSALSRPRRIFTHLRNYLRRYNPRSRRITQEQDTVVSSSSSVPNNNWSHDGSSLHRYPTQEQGTAESALSSVTVNISTYDGPPLRRYPAGEQGIAGSASSSVTINNSTYDGPPLRRYPAREQGIAEFASSSATIDNSTYDGPPLQHYTAQEQEGPTSPSSSRPSTRFTQLRNFLGRDLRPRRTSRGPGTN